MNILNEKNHELAESVYFLSDMIGTKIFHNGKKIGKLRDIAIREHEKLPTVTHLYVSRTFGHKPLMIPWERVAGISSRGITVALPALEQFEGEPAESQVLLNDHILDKKVLDMDDNEVDVVYDVKLVLRGNILYVSDVDFSRYALFKRLGLKSVMKLLFGGTNLLKKETLSWSYVQPLPEDIGRFRGAVKLRILKDKLSDIHPMDMADILEELNEEQRLAIFNELEPEHASDTLEEIEPRVQRTLISSIKKERAAELINDMTPAQAADILSILPAQEADAILELIDKEEEQKIRHMLDKQEEKIINLSTSHFIKLAPDTRVSQVLSQFRDLAKDKDEIAYIYVVDGKGTLVGVLDLKEVLQAELDDRLADIMTTSIIILKPDSTLDEAAEMFSRYNFRSIPVVDEQEVILGIILYRDMMKLKHRFV